MGNGSDRKSAAALDGRLDGGLDGTPAHVADGSTEATVDVEALLQNDRMRENLRQLRIEAADRRARVSAVGDRRSRARQRNAANCATFRMRQEMVTQEYELQVQRLAEENAALEARLRALKAEARDLETKDALA